MAVCRLRFPTDCPPPDGCRAYCQASLGLVPGVKHPLDDQRAKQRRGVKMAEPTVLREPVRKVDVVADEMTIREWLADQARLQVEAFGDSGAPKEGEEFAASFMMNFTALVTELGELSNELAWKPWSKTRGRPYEVQRMAAVIEMVDCMHFVANLFLLLGITADEFRTVWKHKQQVNRDRQVRGYDVTAPGEKEDGRATDDHLPS